ncbi:hypothetical protein CEXT_228131 [Caerostris extrusa]|uniref:Uncharacterized protein n=1 Tax=Caerostris extrusa TaxID=172846 RepID=A0AAV4TMN9_CAEEX|nr:hypothetical protein CEXT_228131 [Caerostris extrusa]
MKFSILDAIQYKQRFILQSPKHGGKPCPGALLEERLCTKALETICLRQGVPPGLPTSGTPPPGANAGLRLRTDFVE